MEFWDYPGTVTTGLLARICFWCSPPAFAIAGFVHSPRLGAIIWLFGWGAALAFQVVYEALRFLQAISRR